MFHNLVNPGEFPENPTIFPKNYHKMATFRQAELLLGSYGTGPLTYYSIPYRVRSPNPLLESNKKEPGMSIACDPRCISIVHSQ